MHAKTLKLVHPNQNRNPNNNQILSFTAPLPEDMNNLIKSTLEKYNSNKISFIQKDKIYYEGRRELLKRSFSNFINNSLKYSKNISKLGVTDKITGEGIIVPFILLIMSAILCYGLSDKIYLT